MEKFVTKNGTVVGFEPSPQVDGTLKYTATVYAGPQPWSVSVADPGSHVLAEIVEVLYEDWKRGTNGKESKE